MYPGMGIVMQTTRKDIEETIRFDELNLDPRILRAVTDMGFEAASPIQAQAIPVEMEGHDMIGQRRPEPVRPQLLEFRFS